MKATDEFTSDREIIQMIQAGQFGADFPGREHGRVCPGARQLLRVANDEAIPEGPRIQEHLLVCPFCRFILRGFLAGLKDDPSLDPVDEPTDNPTDLVRDFISQRKPKLPPP